MPSQFDALPEHVACLSREYDHKNYSYQLHTPPAQQELIIPLRLKLNMLNTVTQTGYHSANVIQNT